MRSLTQCAKQRNICLWSTLSNSIWMSVWSLLDYYVCIICTCMFIYICMLVPRGRKIFAVLKGQKVVAVQNYSALWQAVVRVFQCRTIFSILRSPKIVSVPVALSFAGLRNKNQIKNIKSINSGILKNSRWFLFWLVSVVSGRKYDKVMLNVLRCRLTY